jgi:hypothetical protein
MLHPREDYQRIQDPAGLIPENEPVFLLRAQDKVAARVVRAWALYNQQEGGDPMLSQKALDHAAIMDAWPTKKLADLPERSIAQPSAEPAAESQKDTVDLPAETVEKSENRPGSGKV